MRKILGAILISLLLTLRLIMPVYGFKITSVNSVDRKAQALAHFTMGLIHDWSGNLDKAVESFEMASKLDRGNHAIALRLGANYGRQGNLEKAIEELKRAIALKPDDVQANYLLAIIYTSQSKEKEATKQYEAILQKVVEQDPESREGYIYLGQLYYSQGRIPEAIVQFEKVLTLDPEDDDILSILGSLYLDVPDRLKAIEYFKRSIEKNPYHDGSLNSLGYLYAEEGINLAEAKELIQRALEIDPENGAYLDSLGWVYYQKGDYQRALLFLERAIKFLEDPVIYDHLGDVHFRLGNTNIAIEYWEKSLEMMPDQEAIVEKIQNIHIR